MKRNSNPPEKQPNNPLHGVKLADMLSALQEKYGWDGLALRLDFNCFKSNPTMKSSLKFIRTTPWARQKVEDLYLKLAKGELR
ncbi:VF530 family protein [Luteibaculum oceani]|uniref:DUF2132 domain-containing protein n=1 Tax=Luteibaculum oceani TaxID=1294296 RepID=A0A5C6VKH5_9FLAO|nr:VF530 family protein [Luteibaculum oceani]TXC85154.1 DUF2132 domain-containing protein [Luteibaculum oceani]